MKFLGIDYGTKRIGLAVSDENGTLAFPKEIVLNDADTLKRLGEIIEQEKILEIDPSFQTISEQGYVGDAPTKHRGEDPSLFEGEENSH